MNVMFGNDQFMVIDDFLPTDQFEQLWRWFHVAPFFPNDVRGLHGAWRLDDGRVMRGPDVYYGKVADKVAAANEGAFAHPTGTGLDLMLEHFSRNGEVYEPLVGKEGRDWRTLAAAPRLYERGSSLYWHRDTPAVVTGSCTYYAHPEWNIQWGGELFIAHPDALGIPEERGPSMLAPKEVMGRGKVQLSGHLDNSEVNEELLAHGDGLLRHAEAEPPRHHAHGQSTHDIQSSTCCRGSRPRECHDVPDSARDREGVPGLR